MKCFIGLGSSSESARDRLSRSVEILKGHSRCESVKTSSFYLTPAMLPEGAPSSWNKAYLNGACEMQWRGDDPLELLHFLKATEESFGRRSGERWAPRELDLDLLYFGEESHSSAELQLPHPGIADRSFVLDPLCELQSSLKIPHLNKTVLEQRRSLVTRSPSFMTILNITPDSFSNRQGEGSLPEIEKEIRESAQAGVHWLDLGAESTRPQAATLELEQEWGRLRPVLELVAAMKKSSQHFPKISVDTYKAEIARRALGYGVDAINDVSGGRDPEMIELMGGSSCDYICMHSLSVPASAELVLPEQVDPVDEVLAWARERTEALARAGVDLDRVILDPGIGFNKTASHSLALMQRIEEFYTLPVRILVGHSRKSFMKIFTNQPAYERDFESLGLSMHLGLKGVEIIRVHQAYKHQRAWQACQHLHPQ